MGLYLIKPENHYLVAAGDKSWHRIEQSSVAFNLSPFNCAYKNVCVSLRRCCISLNTVCSLWYKGHLTVHTFKNSIVKKIDENRCVT